MIFDVVINVLESLCMFLFISLITWKITKKETLYSPFFKLLYILSGALFLLFSNAVQIICELSLPQTYSKAAAILLFSVVATVLISAFNDNFKKIHLYYLAVLLSFAVVLIADIISLGMALLIKPDINLVLDKYYVLLCILATALKFMFLVIAILIVQPNFFNKLIKLQKDTGITLLASTVTAIASTQARFPSWLFFYQPKVPKSLRKDDKHV